MEKRIPNSTVVGGLLLIAVANLSGCIRPVPPAGSGKVSFTSDYSPVQFEFPGGWYLNDKEHPFDLQVFSAAQEMNTGVFVYKAADIGADAKPIDVFHDQLADMESKRRNFEVVEPEISYEHSGKRFTTATFAGDKDDSRYYYRFTLIEFPEDASRFAVSLQIALPELWQDSKPILEAITHTATPLGEGT